MSVFEALMFAIAFATLIYCIARDKNKKNKRRKRK